MLIIRNFKYKRNFLKIKLHSHFEVVSLCKFLNVRGFVFDFVGNIKICEGYVQAANTARAIVLNPFYKQILRV